MNASSVIAVIDDDASVRLALQSLLRSFGYEVMLFPSAMAFLHAPERHEPDCIISDVQMPQMSGPDLQDQLVADGDTVPMIFITAFPEKAVEARVIERGAVAILSKPFDGNEIAAHVERALGSAPH
ncbi:response regulator [Kaistia geumhonensis]|uniref:FixJ family two-component response regulator n=1 Tax=Kaistia geumhonensis TaxID=410839 RepID=A0ABU0M8U1_9HYPH|nr:response regulator [Kaistia geumhonensis]MCX5477455.1 response regulator [Kaistia geumhonensis]MDQ0517338.1 FixJ family two-component response regulator [Kaistia geumhonensis]